MPGPIRRNLLLALALLTAPAAVGALHWLLPAGELKDAAGIVQAVITAAAIIAGGIIAAYKLQLFRETEPHLTIAHTVSHRTMENGYVHIAVKAVLRNSSRVAVRLREGRFLLRHIATGLAAATSETAAETKSPVDNVLYPQLPVLDDASFDLGDHEISIEPGQTIQEVLQFVVPDGVTTVLIHYFFHDARFPDDPLRGWGITDVYDIINDQNR